MEIFRRIAVGYKIRRLINQPVAPCVLLLIEKTLRLFPEKIDFSDGELRKDNGFFSENLSAIWHNAEENNANCDENTNCMIWAIFGVLHKKCRHLFNSGIYSLDINELDYNEINTRYIRACFEADVPINTADE